MARYLPFVAQYPLFWRDSCLFWRNNHHFGAIPALSGVILNGFVRFAPRPSFKAI